LIVNGKQTWLAVLEGVSSSRLGLGSYLNPPVIVLYRETIIEIEEGMGRWRDAGRIVTAWDGVMTAAPVRS